MSFIFLSVATVRSFQRISASEGSFLDDDDTAIPSIQVRQNIYINKKQISKKTSLKIVLVIFSRVFFLVFFGVKCQVLSASDNFGRSIALLGDVDDNPDTVDVAVGVHVCF